MRCCVSSLHPMCCSISRFLLFSFIASTSLVLLGCKPDSGSAPAKGGKRIVVIPKGTTHEFWTMVESGVVQAGEETGAEVIWKGPLEESDRAGQIQVVQQFISEGVDGIVLAPLDSKALVGPVQLAGKKNIPVVIFDSGLEAESGKDYISFVATNNRVGGELAGDAMAKALGEQGKVVLMRYMVGSDSTTNREEGFLESLKKYPGITVISDNRFAGATAGEAQTSALNMMDVLREADGIFCPNESSTDGMLQALRKGELAGKVKFVGFDSSKPLLQALEANEIHALVVQNPRQMGYLGVKTMLAHLDGQQVEPLIDTGVMVVTLENLEQPDIKVLLGR